ncbi:hypothetical protein KQI38_10645 [Tissierella carlieri]|jgi:DNA-directed RNA polymerase subunit RPC12/RpoP|uniref:hypothetical protein n=1 Tax=Tissierella carlieri TaxID=689904 RepID=UPI001C123192|nr:hypothetical protein [Tissierella carlieri]MBU5312490.1 hypothetical protein [Tissierella carlieri]MDU5081090.1 hypothetical protein [Bacillota bacterium]
MKKNVNKVILCLTLIAILAVSFATSSMYNVVEAAAINSEVEVASTCSKHLYSTKVVRDYKDHYENGKLVYTLVTEYVYNRCTRCGYEEFVDARTHIIYP